MAGLGLQMHKVLFDFQGQEEGELSVSKGETVRVSKKNPSPSMDPGWTLVERLAPPFAKGYVPTGRLLLVELNDILSLLTDSKLSFCCAGYIAPIVSSPARYSATVSSARSPVSQPESPRSEAETTPTKVSKFSNIRRLSDPRLPVHLLETLNVSDANSPIPSKKKDMMAAEPKASLVEFKRGAAALGKLTGSDADVERAMQKQDELFNQITEMRRKQADVLDTSLQNLDLNSNQVRTMNENLMSRISQLDAQLDKERQQWKQKVDADNLELNRRVSQLYS